ncbi:Rid family detoxifying hydrolase [Mesorhizobium sp. 1B3]|uniref:Rid family detoxifying hydrolase n=1 Tax=Mesorhizobium sp. 1B3 TaxID=3243599 RepID=UPI003D9603C9
MKAISTTAAPAAIGPYSQAIIHGGTLYVSGQLPIDPVIGSFSSEDPAEQIRQCLANIAAIAKAAGTDMAHCLKTTVLVSDLSRFAEINAVYASFFSEPFPARATFEVSRLPKDAQVEIEAVFALPGQAGSA